MPAEQIPELFAVFLAKVLFGFGTPAFLILLGLVAGRAAERRHFRSLERRERDLADMNATDVRTYLGGAEPSRRAALVTAEVVIANDYLKSLLSALRKIVGGELRSYGSLMLRARREALLRLKEKARRMGHNAICNVRYETADIGGMARKGGAATVVVSASATAYTTPAGLRS